MIVILIYKKEHPFQLRGAPAAGAAPAAYHAACRMGIRLAVAAVTSGLVAKKRYSGQRKP